MEKCVILLSGGPDSTTAAFWATERYKTYALHFNYGQINAEREQVCAKKIANYLEIPIEVIHIPGLKDVFLDKIGDAIDYNIGCWETLPFMLGFPISLAASYGITIGAEAIVLGVHATDTKDHPEYRKEALQAIENAIAIATGKKIKIITPFINMAKSDVIKFGHSRKIPYENTWSCLLNDLSHCGRCWGCARRKLAFSEAGVPDPTEYEYKEIIHIDKIDLTSLPSRRGLIFPPISKEKKIN